MRVDHFKRERVDAIAGHVDIFVSQFRISNVFRKNSSKGKGVILNYDGVGHNFTV